MPIPKALPGDFPGRFREILSDPLNLCIARVAEAGTVSDGLVTLHNGHRVPLQGPSAYYGSFSDILIFNRGVHEPLEEYVFQQVLRTLPAMPDPQTAVMVELGAYWAHYAMWFLQYHPQGRAIMVEPGAEERRAGEANFERNGYSGTFIAAKVGSGGVAVDGLMAERGIEQLTILHADIQGAEVEMLRGAKSSLANQRIDNVFVSTHSQYLHRTCHGILTEHGYRVEVTSDFDTDTTSHDGFLFARRSALLPIFQDFRPLGREAITTATPTELLASIKHLLPG
jgi:hypothetical protein